MNNKELIQKIIFEAIDEFNDTQDSEFQISKDINEILFSRPGYTKTGKLDSMALVYFIVTVEEHLQLHFGKSFNLETNLLFENKETLLNSIQNLISYIEKII
jgi:hypothetical protein